MFNTTASFLTLLYVLGFFSNISYAPYVETSVMDYLELVQYLQSFSLLETPALTLEFV